MGALLGQERKAMSHTYYDGCTPEKTEKKLCVATSTLVPEN